MKNIFILRQGNSAEASGVNAVTKGHVAHVISLVLLALFSLCATAYATPSETPPVPAEGPYAVTILVDSGYKPYSYEENGEAKGIYVNVLRAVFDKMENYKVTMEPVPWKRGKKMMEDGEGFGLMPAFFHGHDWKYLYPYSLPFYTENIVAICTAEALSKPRPIWPDDYKGLRVGNVAGFSGWGGEAFYTLVKAGEINYEEAPNASTNILKLGAQRIDCIMMEERAFKIEYTRLKETGEYKATYPEPMKGAVIGSDPVYIGYSKTARDMNKYPFHDDFMQTFDSILYQMLKSGEVTAIMDAYRE